MELQYRHKSTHIRELSPLIVRLKPIEQYQSPWKYLPKIKHNYFQEDYTFSVKKRKLKLLIPTVNDSELIYDTHKSSLLNRKVFPNKIVKFRSLSPLKKA